LTSNASKGINIAAFALLRNVGSQSLLAALGALHRGFCCHSASNSASYALLGGSLAGRGEQLLNTSGGCNQAQAGTKRNLIKVLAEVILGGSSFLPSQLIGCAFRFFRLINAVVNGAFDGASTLCSAHYFWRNIGNSRDRSNCSGCQTQSGCSRGGKHCRKVWNKRANALGN
jgi:hypothetical protein